MKVNFPYHHIYTTKFDITIQKIHFTKQIITILSHEKWFKKHIIHDKNLNSTLCDRNQTNNKNDDA